MTEIIVISILIAVFFLQGLRKIPIPYIGQLTILGRRVAGKYRKEGWTFLPIYPFWYGVELISMERIRFNVVIEGARTPDRAESKIPVALTIVVIPELSINYINSGKEEGVKEQLTGKVEERVREWCMSNEGGPADWIELNQSHLEGTSVLVKKLASNSLEEVPDYAQKVPTWIWLRFFAQPQPQKFLINEKDWAEPETEGGKNWEKVDNIFNDFPEDKQIKLKKSITKRREQIEALRTGTGTIVVEDLGIQIERLNIGDIDVLGEVAKQAEMEAKEEQERKAEKKELENVIERVKTFQELGYSLEQSLEAVQTERGKVTKTIQENKFNISPETREMIEKTFSGLGAQIIEMLTKQKEGNK